MKKTSILFLFALSLGLQTLMAAPKQLKPVSDYIAQQIKDNRIAGAVSLVFYKGEIVHFEAAGHADVEGGKLMKKDSIFRIYSMTKPITSVAAMILIEQGKMKLDDPVANYLPKFKNPRVYSKDGKHTKAKRPITVRHLLSHSSGLTYGIFGDHPVDQMYRKANPMNNNHTNKDLVDVLGPIPLVSHPGEVWRYSLSTDVLGRLVEVVSGKKLSEFFAERIFKPLNMKDSSFHVLKDKHSRFTVTYTWAAGKRNVSDHPSRSRFVRPAVWESGGGGLTSSTRDYLRFCQMLLNGGQLGKIRLLKESSVQQMNLSAEGVKGITMGSNAAFGLGFRVRLKGDPKGAGKGAYNWGGYASTTFQIDPANKLILIGMTQKVPTDNGFVEGFKQAVYRSIMKD